MNRPRRGSGFSLIELMVAVSLGLLVIAAVGNVFVATSRSYKEDDKVSRMQDNLRFAMAQVVMDLEMAGFFAQAGNPSVDIDLDTATLASYTATDCTYAWLFQDLRAFDTISGTADEVSAKFPCITAARGYQPDTDVIAVKRVRGSCIDPPTGTEKDNNYYLRTNGYESVLYRNSGTVPSPLGAACPTTPTSATVDIYKFEPAIWFVGLNEGVPSLCRMGLEAGQKLEISCVAEGIEDLQVEVGMDTTGDGVPDYFTSFNAEPGATASARIVAARVHLLARSAQPDPNYVNEKSYTLGNHVIDAKNDGYYRKALSSVVLMRNAANRISPYALPE